MMMATTMTAPTFSVDLSKHRWAVVWVSAQTKRSNKPLNSNLRVAALTTRYMQFDTVLMRHVDVFDIGNERSQQTVMEPQWQHHALCSRTFFPHLLRLHDFPWMYRLFHIRVIKPRLLEWNWALTTKPSECSTQRKNFLETALLLAMPISKRLLKCECGGFEC